MMPLVGESSDFKHFIFTVAIGLTWNAAEVQQTTTIGGSPSDGASISINFLYSPFPEKIYNFCNGLE